MAMKANSLISLMM